MNWDMVSALAELSDLIVLSYKQGNAGSTNVLNKLGFKERGSGFSGDLNCLEHTCLFALVRPSTAHCDSGLFMDYAIRNYSGDILHGATRKMQFDRTLVNFIACI